MRSVSFFVALALFGAMALPACQQTRSHSERASLRPGESGYEVHDIGAQFDLAGRDAVVIRVEDEYRLILESEGEWGRGMFESGWAMSGPDMEWAEWLDVPQVEGLKLAFLSPKEIAVRYTPPEAPAR